MFPVATPSSPQRRSAWRLAGLALLPLAAATAHAADTESDRAYCERQQEPARTVCLRDLASSASAAGASAGARSGPVGPTAFKVVGGDHVDATTFKGFQTW